MNALDYRLIALGSAGGAALGFATLWLRAQARRGAPLPLRAAVGTTALVAGGAALFAFARVFAPTSVAFAGVATFLITAIVAVVNAAGTLQLPARWMRVSDAELRLLRHPLSGVRTFGYLLNRTALRNLGGEVYLRAAPGPTSLLPGLAQAASVHLWAGLLCLTHAAILAIEGRWTAFATSMALNFAINLWPLLHLRLTSGRLQRARIARSTN